MATIHSTLRIRPGEHFSNSPSHCPFVFVAIILIYTFIYLQTFSSVFGVCVCVVCLHIFQIESQTGSN